MLPGRRPRWSCSIPVVVLLAVFLLQIIVASGTKSPTFDETGDLAAGVSYLQTGEVRANPQHPPLLKELAAIPPAMAGIRLPAGDAVQRMLGGAGGEREAGSRLIAENGPDRVMFLARLPFILMSAMLGFLIYWWGRKLLGERAAIAALFLYTFNQTLLAHSYLVTMDMGLAAFTVLFLFALWEYLHRPGMKQLLLCGASLGLLLAVKFSAVFLLPVALVLITAAIRRPPAAAAGSAILDIYSLSKAGQERDAVRGYTAGACAFVLMCLVASVVIQALYLSPGGLFLYHSGLQQVNADHNKDYLVFLAGQLDHRFAGYFAAAYLLKEPIASVLLAGIGLFALMRKRTDAMVRLFLLVPPAVLFAAHTIWADNLGIRYIIPVLPFTCLIGGAGAARLLENGRRWGRPAAAVLGAWVVLAAAGVYPDHLSYFNEAACLAGNPGGIGLDGGTRCGTAWLDDSNVDWGQGLKQLKAWTDANARGRKIRLAYFGSFTPEAYGLQCERVGVEQLMQAPTPGLYVVSAHLVARVPALAGRFQQGAAEWLRQTPVAIVGHSLYVYEVR
jgi:predicted membrane-bound mannosyltransferase